MKRITRLAVTVAAMLLGLPALAQEQTRAVVKGQAASANKAGTTPEVEGRTDRAAPASSPRARPGAVAARKAAAASSNLAGTTPEVEGETDKPVLTTKVPPADRAAARAKRKADAASSNKAKAPPPQGELSK